jgi:tetratricopeptide (TPR) repeat protein
VNSVEARLKVTGGVSARQPDAGSAVGAAEIEFDDAVLGHGLPAQAEEALRIAGVSRADPPRAMAALMRARSLAPDHPAVLIAFYRYHFYGHQLRQARAVSCEALVVGARSLGLPLLWRDVPAQPLAGAADDPATRFYLWVLKGYAYLSLRLGDLDEARDALAKLRALDPEDRVGAALLEAVRQRRERHAGGSDGDDDGPALPVFGAAAWARVAETNRSSGVAG